MLEYFAQQGNIYDFLVKIAQQFHSSHGKGYLMWNFDREWVKNFDSLAYKCVTQNREISWEQITELISNSLTYIPLSRIRELIDSPKSESAKIRAEVYSRVFDQTEFFKYNPSKNALIIISIEQVFVDYMQEIPGFLETPLEAKILCHQISRFGIVK